MKYFVRIKKVGTVDNSDYPQGYGDLHEFFDGFTDELPTVGCSFTLCGGTPHAGIRTSRIVKVEDNKFHTLNSIYEWKVISKSGVSEPGEFDQTLMEYVKEMPHNFVEFLLVPVLVIAGISAIAFICYLVQQLIVFVF